MIDPELHARIRRLFFAEHWRAGTIASELNLHPDTVRRALALDQPHRAMSLRPSMIDPFLPFVRQILEQHPRLRATRIHRMLEERGFSGSAVQTRRAVARLRPARSNVYLNLTAFPGDQAQADWADFGKVTLLGTHRRLSCFVMTLSWSRALYLEFFLNQSMESFQLGHVRAFQFFQGQPRHVLYDNMKTAVAERLGGLVRFNPGLLDLASHFHFEPKACPVRAANQKGRVERAIRYVRDSFWAGRVFTTLDHCNQLAWDWRDLVAHQRPWPQDPARTVADAFAEERTVLTRPPAQPFEPCHLVPVRSTKMLSVHFDRNEYSIPPEAVGRPLTVAATDVEVRVLDGQTVVARHARSYAARQYVLDPAHQSAALKMRRKAVGATAVSRLTIAIPEARTLLERAFHLGESVQQQTSQLTKMLQEHGATRLRRAIVEALQRNTPRATSVAFLVRQHERETGPPLEVDLSRYPEYEDLRVPPHRLDTYDQLAWDGEARGEEVAHDRDSD